MHLLESEITRSPDRGVRPGGHGVHPPPLFAQRSIVAMMQCAVWIAALALSRRGCCSRCGT
jgi:hypothetical protein